MRTTAGDAVFEAERPRLFGLAYRMLGTVSDADDIVQEAWLRFDRTGHVERPAAFLTTVTTRLAIDRLRSAQRRRETYVGPWLPEPVLTDGDPAHIVEADETVTLGFLHVLERLSPVDRAVFLLREVFGLGYHEISVVVERSESACRQIAKRARDRVRADQPRFEVEPDRRRALLDAFLDAVSSGDPEHLERLLAEDAVLTSDGGPDHHAARRPVVGADRIGRLLVNLFRRMPEGGWVDILEVNGELAGLAVVDDEPLVLLEVEFDGTLVRRLHNVVNPDKLAAVSAEWRARRSRGPRRAS